MVFNLVKDAVTVVFIASGTSSTTLVITWLIILSTSSDLEKSKTALVLSSFSNILSAITLYTSSVVGAILLSIPVRAETPDTKEVAVISKLLATVKSFIFVSLTKFTSKSATLKSKATAVVVLASSRSSFVAATSLFSFFFSITNFTTLVIGLTTSSLVEVLNVS